MPKAIVYVRADDARAIEAVTGKEIAEWVREQVAIAVDQWKAQRVIAQQEQERIL